MLKHTGNGINYYHFQPSAKGSSDQNVLEALHLVKSELFLTALRSESCQKPSLERLLASPQSAGGQLLCMISPPEDRMEGGGAGSSKESVLKEPCRSMLIHSAPDSSWFLY